MKKFIFYTFLSLISAQAIALPVQYTRIVIPNEKGEPSKTIDLIGDFHAPMQYISNKRNNECSEEYLTSQEKMSFVPSERAFCSATNVHTRSMPHLLRNRHCCHSPRERSASEMPTAFETFRAQVRVGVYDDHQCETCAPRHLQFAQTWRWKSPLLANRYKSHLRVRQK